MPSGRTSIVCAGSSRFTPSKNVSSPSSCNRNRRKRRSASTSGRRGTRAFWNSAFSSEREREAGRAVDVVERLDAEAVAGEEQLAALVIGDREREHAGEVVDDVAAPLLEAAEDDFGVGVVGDEPAAALLELAAQLGVVVDLAVEDEREVAVVAVERLVAGRDVDDREPAHPDREVLADVGALPVGPAVHDRPQHLFQAARDRSRRTRRCHTSRCRLRGGSAYGSIGAAAQSGSGGASVLGPTWRSSQRFTGAASRQARDDALRRGRGVQPRGRAERAPDVHALHPQQLDAWVVGVEAARRALQRVARRDVVLLSCGARRRPSPSFGPGAVVGDRVAEPLAAGRTRRW